MCWILRQQQKTPQILISVHYKLLHGTLLLYHKNPLKKSCTGFRVGRPVFSSWCHLEMPGSLGMSPSLAVVAESPSAFKVVGKWRCFDWFHLMLGTTHRKWDECLVFNRYNGRKKIKAFCRADVWWKFTRRSFGLTFQRNTLQGHS